MIRVIETLLDEGTVGHGDAHGGVPTALSLASVYPNPFNLSVTIQVDNPVAQAVELAVYDLSGRWLDEIYAGRLAAGSHTFRWSAAGPDAAPLNSGVYFIRLAGEAAQITRKVVLLK